MPSIRFTPALAVVEAQDHVLVLVLDRLDEHGAPRLISGTGLVIWDAIDGKRSASEIAQVVGEAYPGVDVREDVDSFLEDLVRVGVLE